MRKIAGVWAANFMLQGWTTATPNLVNKNKEDAEKAFDDFLREASNNNETPYTMKDGVMVWKDQQLKS